MDLADGQSSAVYSTIFPDTGEGLADWERVLALPDPCLIGQAQTVGQRVQAVVSKLQGRAGQSKAFFISLAKSMGYDITITTFQPARAGLARAGDAINGGDWSFAWRINAPAVTAIHARIGIKVLAGAANDFLTMKNKPSTLDGELWHSGTFDPSSKADKATTLAGYGITNAYTTQQIDTEFSKRAPLISPVFTGMPSGPTAPAGTATTQFATTAFVAGLGSGKLSIGHATGIAGVSPGQVQYATASSGGSEARSRNVVRGLAVVHVPDGEQVWGLMPDFRGDVYRVSDGQAVRWERFGPLPDDLTAERCPGPFHSWQGGKWQLDKKAETEALTTLALVERDRLLGDATTRIAPLQDAVDLGDASSDEE
eukprot:gene4998-7681_t